MMMTQNRPRFAQILSTGHYVPERVLTNADVDELLGESTSEWLIENTGIRERRYMSEDQTTSDLVVEASQKALRKAGVHPEEVDLIIVSTDTPDYLSPATATAVQAKLGARNAGIYDVNSACAGWVTALDQGARYLATEDEFNYVLVTGGYGMSRFIDFGDKYTANLFADGAGAVLLGVGEEPGFLASKLSAMGDYYDALGIYTGGAARPCTQENMEKFGPPRVQFVKKFPKTFNLERWPGLIETALKKASLSHDDVDLYLFTQLNLRTIEAVMETLEQPMEKTYWVMDRWGYTGSPCVAMALDDAIDHGKGPSPGEHVLFCTSGGGISIAVSIWRWTAEG
jgi:3-oxoacyl-[acyl-carrier-protein] synthase-3